jgi:hypothetical protein
LHIGREAFGLRALKKSGFERDVGFSGALGSSAGDTVARQDMPELGTPIGFGPRGRMPAVSGMRPQPGTGEPP